MRWVIFISFGIIQFILTALKGLLRWCLVPCGGRKMSPRNLAIDYICISFIEPILVALKIKYCFSRCYVASAVSHNTLVHMKSLNKTDSPIFVILCVLCFKNQPFKLLFYFTVAGVVLCGSLKTSPRISP